MEYIFVSLSLSVLFAVLGIIKIWQLPKEKVYVNYRWSEDDAATVRKNRKRFKFLMIVCASVFVFWLGINYWLLPTIAANQLSLYWEIFITCLMAVPLYSFDNDLDMEISLRSLIAPVVVLLFIVVAAISSSKMFNAKKYFNMLECEVATDSMFNKNVSPTQLEKMRVVNERVAYRLAAQTMEQITSLGSRCDIGEMSLQKLTGNFQVTTGEGKKLDLSFEDDFVWVAPLEHSGFWKWNRFSSTPGYLLVSATNPNQFYLVTEVNGEKINLRYLQSAYWGENLQRLVRRAGFTNVILYDNGIQIDENGRPFNVFALIENTIKFDGEKVTGIVVVDLQNGDIKEYNLENIPAFVDIVQPEYLMMDYVRWYGDLQLGYFNWSGLTRLAPTPGMQPVYGKTNCAYYTGMQSMGSDDATSGFLLVDVQTAKATFYKLSGTNEESAKNSINAYEWVANFKGGYYADDAIFYNVVGMYTYYSPILNSNNGMPVGHGFCSVKNKNITGAGKTKEEALAAYIQSYQRNQNDQVLTGGSAEDKAEVVEIVQMKQEGSRYFFRFKGYESKEFYAFSELIPNVRWIDGVKGEKLSVVFRLSEEREIPITSLEKN